MQRASVDDPAIEPYARDAVVPAAPAIDFVAVYRAHFAFVWRSLRRLGVAEHALDDAAQEVFITVHRRLGEFEGRSSIKMWLFGILLNTARHHRRSMARRRDQDPRPDVVIDAAHGGPLESLARAQAVAVLHGFLEGLDDTLRECFVLSELEQMTAPEVAAATGANLHTVHSRIRTARQQFEQMVARRRAGDPWSRP
jgi:RNA polymerase sigma-70 factor (ECF subfamily)